MRYVLCKVKEIFGVLFQLKFSNFKLLIVIDNFIQKTFLIYFA